MCYLPGPDGICSLFSGCLVFSLFPFLFSFGLNIYITFNFLHMSVLLMPKSMHHLHAGAQGGQKRALDALELT